MPSRKRNQITDAKALRALAHPLRWKLLELIDKEGTATATYCAKQTGESVANCSYHLNTLARYGYVEQAEGGQGREKPWRVLDREKSWTDVGLDPEGAVAARAATMAFLDFRLSEIRERQLTAQAEPDDWRDALGADSPSVFLTPAEVTEIREEIRAILDRYKDRHDSPDLRPDGARSVNLFLSAAVAPQTD